MTEFIDSFAIYALISGSPTASQQSLQNRWNALSGATEGVQAGQGARGNPALYLPFGTSIVKTFSHQATFTLGFRLNIGNIAGVGGATLIDFSNCGFNLASLKIGTDGSILVFGNNSPSTVIATAPAATIPASTNIYLELQATASADGSGNLSVACEVRTNGVTVTTGSAAIGRNVNSLVSLGPNFNQISLSSGVGSNGQSYISDLYLTNGSGTTNTGFLGSAQSPYGVEIDAILPNADTTTVQWTPSTGSDHFSLVNELPADSTPYVSTQTPTDVDSYEWQDIATFNGTVKTVQMSWYGQSVAEGTRTFKGNIGPAGAQEQTAEFGLCSSFFYRHQAFDVDPATGIAWTQPNFNAKAFGITLVQ